MKHLSLFNIMERLNYVATYSLHKDHVVYTKPAKQISE